MGVGLCSYKQSRSDISDANISGAVAGDEVEYFPQDWTTTTTWFWRWIRNQNYSDCYCAPGDSTVATPLFPLYCFSCGHCWHTWKLTQRSFLEKVSAASFSSWEVSWGNDNVKIWPLMVNKDRAYLKLRIFHLATPWFEDQLATPLVRYGGNLGSKVCSV